MILIADSHLSVRIEFSVCCNDYKVSNYDDDFGDGYDDDDYSDHDKTITCCFSY